MIHQYWDARRDEAVRRRREVVTDTTRCSQQQTLYDIPSGAISANGAEQSRVEAIIRQCDAILPTLLALANDVRRVTREHTDLDQRNRAVDELIAAVPVVSKWMRQPGGAVAEDVVMPNLITMLTANNAVCCASDDPTNFCAACEEAYRRGGPRSSLVTNENPDSRRQTMRPGDSTLAYLRSRECHISTRSPVQNCA